MPFRRPNIQLRNTDGSHNRYLTVSELEQLLYSKPPQVKKVRNPKLKRQVYELLPPVIALRSMHEASPPSITCSDMKANVGLSSVGAKKRARIKIREFKKTSRRAAYPNDAKYVDDKKAAKE